MRISTNFLNKPVLCLMEEESSEDEPSTTLASQPFSCCSLMLSRARDMSAYGSKVLPEVTRVFLSACARAPMRNWRLSVSASLDMDGRDVINSRLFRPRGTQREASSTQTHNKMKDVEIALLPRSYHHRWNKKKKIQKSYLHIDELTNVYIIILTCTPTWNRKEKN